MDQALTPGGLHIVVMPDYRLVQTPKIARYLAASSRWTDIGATPKAKS
jgi:hypothetical protein